MRFRCRGCVLCFGTGHRPPDTGVGHLVLVRREPGRSCAEPASRPSAPRSGGGAERSALTAASTRARCLLSDEDYQPPFLPTDSAEDPIIRGRFRNGYLSGKMKMRPLHDDEKTKIAHATTCCYCGRASKLSLDHLIPQLKGGADAADNITYACRSCNSSKGPKDMVLWLVSKHRFPAILVLRRYLKLAARRCEDADLMDTPWADLPDASLPFDKQSLRVNWPELSAHRLWPDPPDPPEP